MAAILKSKMAINLVSLYTIMAPRIHKSSLLVSLISLLRSRNAKIVFLKMSNIGRHFEIQNGSKFSIFIYNNCPNDTQKYTFGVLYYIVEVEECEFLYPHKRSLGGVYRSELVGRSVGRSVCPLVFACPDDNS